MIAADTPPNPQDDPIEAYVRAIVARFKLGPTGQNSHLTAGDKGELQVALEVIGGNLLLVFGTQLQWVAMTPNEARAFAASLLAMAKKAEGR